MNLAIDFTLGRRILALAGPTIAAMLSQTAINLVDTILVGRLPADRSIAGQSAMGISVILLWAVGGFLSSIAIGTQALTARRIGARQPLAAGQTLCNSLFTAAILGIALSIASVIATPFFFPLLHSDPNVVRLGIPFLQLRFAAILSMVATASYKSFFDGLGRTHVHMYAAIVMNILNFVLNLLLVFGLCGFPRLEVTGSGLASAISSYVGLLFLVGWSLGPELRRTFRVYRLRNLSGRICLQIARLSYPSGLATVFVMSGFTLFLRIVAHLDDLEGHPAPYLTTATKIIIDALSITFMSCLAYGTATATLVGQNMGAKKLELAERYAREAAKIGAYLLGAVGLVTIVCPDIWLRIFSKDLEVLVVARPVLRMMGVALPLICVAMVFTQALFAAGNARFVMWAEFVLHFTCLVPLAFLLGITLNLGIMGVWASALAYVVLLALVMWRKFTQGEWKSIRI